MVLKKFTQYEGIHTKEMDCLISEMNRFMRLHADEHPQGRWETMGDTFIGVVEYTIEVREPETELEKLEEEHGKHHCYECPCLEVDTDKRRKCYPCSIGGMSRTDSPCCEWFYKQLKAGNINVL